MKYYAIQCPPESNWQHLWWIADSEFNSWQAFFQYPSLSGERMPYRLCLADAIRAYEAIGYKCVQVDIKIITPPEREE